MNYQLSTKRYHKRKQFVLLSIAGVILFITFLLLTSIFGSGITGVTSTAVRFITGTESLIEQSLVTKQELIKENEMLKEELKRVEIIQILQQGITDRNKSLEAELGRRIESKILAGIIKKPPFTPYDIYTIDAGRAQGVSIGDIAITGDYIALGVVTRSGEKTSRVNLFTSSGRRTIVEINGYAAEAEGIGGGVLKISVPRDFEVLAGDMVRLPGFAHYVVGAVVDTQQKPQDSFKSIIVRVPINTQLLSYISIFPYTVDEDE